MFESIWWIDGLTARTRNILFLQDFTIAAQPAAEQFRAVQKYFRNSQRARTAVWSQPLIESVRSFYLSLKEK